MCTVFGNAFLKGKKEPPSVVKKINGRIEIKLNVKINVKNKTEGN